MSKMKIAKIITVLGILVFLKISLISVTRISEPITNVIVFAGFLIYAIFLGTSELKKIEKKKKLGN